MNIKSLDKKQKIIAAILVVALVVLAWQAYDMFFANSGDVSQLKPKTTSSMSRLGASATPMKKTTQSFSPTYTATSAKTTEVANKEESKDIKDTLVPTLKKTTQQEKNSSNSAMESSSESMETQTEMPVAPKKVAVSPVSMENKAAIRQKQQEQQVYLKAVSQYQNSKLKESMAQSQAAIAASRLQAAKADFQLKMFDSCQGNYHVKYVGKQNGHWQALLAKGDKLMTVMPGTRLADGVVVSSISQKGVVVRDGKVRNFIRFSSGLEDDCTILP